MMSVEDLLVLNLVSRFHREQRGCQHMLGECLMIDDFKCLVKEPLKLPLHNEFLLHSIMLPTELYLVSPDFSHRIPG